MKKIYLFLLSFVISYNVFAQAPSKKCPTCGLSVAKCQYKGKHPKQQSSSTANSGNSVKTNPYSTAMKKGRDFYKTYNYSRAIQYYESLFLKFPSHSIEIRSEIEKCEEIVSHQAQHKAMTPELATALKTYKIKDGVGNGLIPVEKDGLYGYINLKGENVIPCKYKSVARFREGIARVRNKEGQTGFIDTEGNTVIPFSKKETGSCFYDGFVGTSTPEGMGFMDKKGQIVYSGKMHVYNYDCIFSEGVAAVMVGENKYAYANEFGDFRVEPFEAYNALPFFKNVAPVRIKRNGKIRAALISEFGDVIKFFEDYFEIKPFSEGLACMEYAHNGDSRKFKSVFIDEKGRPVLVLPYHSCGNFNDGLAYFDKEIKGGFKYGYIDKHGNVVIDAIYDYACDYSEGFAMINKGEKWGLLDKFGNCSLTYQ